MHNDARLNRLDLDSLHKHTKHADTGPSVVRASAFMLSVIVLSDKMLSIIILR